MKKENKQFYEIWVDCSNCGERNNVRIEKGKIIDEKECPNCGCTLLERVNK